MLTFITKLKQQSGNASIEFIWVSIILVFIFLFVFQMFTVTFKSSGIMNKTRVMAFSQIGPEGMIRAMDAQDTQGYEIPNTCLPGSAFELKEDDDESLCRSELHYRMHDGPGITTYDYGVSEFRHLIEHRFILVLSNESQIR